MDQCFDRGVKLIAIVHVATCCVDTATKFLRSFGLKQVHLIHDGEPLVAALAHEIVDVTGGSSTSTKASPSRHAPVAERAIRTLKETASANELHAKGVNNLRLLANEKAMELLHVHAACSHNCFAASSGSMLCPLQRALGESHVPHLLFPFACVVYVQPPQHLASQVDGRYDIGSYLGPVVGGLGHHCMIRLANGSMKRCVARALKMAYPVTFSSNLLPTIAEPNPDEPDYESLPGIALPKKSVPLPRFHSRKCKVRFRDYVKNTLGDLDNPEVQQQDPKKPRVQINTEPEIVEFDELGEYEPSLPGAASDERFPELFDPDHPDYNQGLPPASGGSPFPPPADLPQEYLPGGDVDMDQVDMEDYTVPMEMAQAPDALDQEGVLQHMHASVPHVKSHLSPWDYGDVGLFAAQMKRKAAAQHSNPDEGVMMPFGDREIWVIKPTSVTDDISGLPLDLRRLGLGCRRRCLLCIAWV